MSFKKHNRGVTLVELAIVVAVIGLLVSAALGGLYMLKSAQLRRAVTDFGKIKTGITAFEAEYGYMPGDLPNASSFMTGVANGDGDRAVEFSVDTAGTPKEDLYVWQHLREADILPGAFTGTESSGTARYKLEENLPISEAYKNAGFMFRTESDSSGNTIYGTRGTTIRLGTIVNIVASTGLQYPTGGVTNAKDAYSIDAKIDDGKASSGEFYTIREVKDGGSTGCVDALWSAASANYDLADTSNITCHFVYWYKQIR